MNSGAIIGGVSACLAIFFLIVVLPGFRIVNEYERGVIFRLGRCKGAKGPGLFYIIPLIDKMVKTNLQVIAAPVASQRCDHKRQRDCRRRCRCLFPGY